MCGNKEFKCWKQNAYGNYQFRTSQSLPPQHIIVVPIMIFSQNSLSQPYGNIVERHFCWKSSLLAILCITASDVSVAGATQQGSSMLGSPSFEGTGMTSKNAQK